MAVTYTAVVELSPVPRVVVTGTGYPGASTTDLVTRTNGDGTKEQVRSLPVAGAAGVFTWFDYEWPQGQTVTYTVGGWSGTVVTPALQGWLVVPDHPADSVPLLINTGGYTGWSRPSTVNSTPILGSPTPYSVDLQRQDASGQLAVLCLDDVSQQALRKAINYPGPKLFSWSPSQWKAAGVRWAFVSDFSEVPGAAQASPSWVTTLTLVPASRPAVAFGDQVTGSMAGKAWPDLAGKAWTDLAGWVWQ